ncbi:MAG: hypothetical protein JXM71_02145 [Spirochaetales bacterium]|nr:hypothetical protein [Spirochaetales bacterium]
MELDQSVRVKFDAVINSVKEPQSELSLAELGLVTKISYYAADKTIIVFLATDAPGRECPACSAINGFVVNTIERDLKAALEKEFPGWTIEVR